jgi:phage-related protein
MANITLGELRNLWKTVSDWVSGTGADVPKVQDEDVKEAIDALQELIGEVSANPTSNTLLERIQRLQAEIAALSDKIDDLTDENQNLKVTLFGNDVVIGLLADRPTASEMRGRGYYAWDETDGHKLKYSDGTDWVVNQ